TGSTAANALQPLRTSSRLRKRFERTDPCDLPVAALWMILWDVQPLGPSGNFAKPRFQKPSSQGQPLTISPDIRPIDARQPWILRAAVRKTLMSRRQSFSPA